jgi:hypothetical protein
MKTILGTIAVLSILGAAGNLTRPTQPCLADENAQAQREIQQLIRDLASEAFDVRETAMRRLMERKDAVSALREAQRSSDAEVARRAARILDVLAEKAKKRAFARLDRMAKEGAVDLAIEQFVQRHNWDNETACWQAFAELGGSLADIEKRLYEKSSLPVSDGTPAWDFRRYVEKQKPEFATGGRLGPRQMPLINRVVIRAEEIDRDINLYDSLVAVSERVQARRVSRSVILAGGPIHVTASESSLFVCDGPFEEKSDLKNCLVVASGDVFCSKSLTNCRIITGGKLILGEGGHATNCVVKESEENPLGFVKFFDPALVGIKVEKDDSGVKVKDAPKSKPFGTAGLRSGDIILALDGKEPSDPETFRRLLRRRLVADEEMVFRVRRGNESLEIKVWVSDECVIPAPRLKAKDR